MNYYPFHIGDYARATRHLSWDENMAYRQLLDVYYTTEQPLPNDLRKVCRLAMATTEDQRQAVAVVLEEFFKLTDAGWVNVRADREIDAMRDKQQKQRDKAFKRWQKPQQDAGNATAEDRDATADATARKTTADALPPTPTPTPTPKEEIHPPATLVPPAVAGNESPKPLTGQDLIAEGVEPKVAADWLLIRRAKKAPLTQTAWDGVKREAAAAGLTPGQAVKTAVESGWQVFKADWMARANAALPIRAGPQAAGVTVPSDEAARSLAYLAAQADRGAVKPPAEALAKLRALTGRATA